MQTPLRLDRLRARLRFHLQNRLCIAVALLCGTSVAQPAEVTLFGNIPAQVAEWALKAFSEHSGSGVIMNANTVDGIRTNRMEGPTRHRRRCSVCSPGRA